MIDQQWKIWKRQIGPALAGTLILLISGCGQEPLERVEDANKTKPINAAFTPTFNRDIAPIVFKSCAPCHHPGDSTSAPFPLLSYRDVKSHASQIVEVTASRFMPPWLVEHADFPFADDSRLSKAEIDAFRAWLVAGTPEGEPDDLPPAPQLVEGWQLGEPDLIVRMPEDYQLRAEGQDEFRNFVAAVPVSEARWVRAVELRPTNPRAIHHAELEFDPTDGSRLLDDRDPLPGFGGMEPGDAAHRPDGHFYGWVPGRPPYPGADDVAWRLEVGTDLVLKLHMFPTGKQEVVNMEVGFHFNDDAPTRSVTSINLGSRSIDIPAGEKNYSFKKRYRLPVDVKVHAVAPHAHYLGKALRADAITADGSRRTLFHISNWDFNWQGEYVYSEPIALSKGTEIVMQYGYDNSTGNVRNPHTPPKRVVYGPRTTDEMGDLNIRVETENALDRRKLSADVSRHQIQTVVLGLYDEIARDPKDIEAHASLAGMMLSAGNDGIAEKHLRKILTIEPRHVYGNSLMGALLIGRKDLKGALEHLNIAVEEDPAHAEVRQNLAAALVQMGKIDAAAYHMQKAVQIRPNIKCHYFLGNYYYRKKKWRFAVKHLKAALSYNADLVDIRLLLSKSLLQQGKKSEAVEVLTETLKKNPSFSEARQLLNEIKAGKAIEPKPTPDSK